MSQDVGFFALLREMSVRPESFTGARTARSVEVFLAGYSRARRDLGLPGIPTSEAERWQKFQDWLKTKYSAKGTFGWCEVLERDHPADGASVFFRLLDEFPAQSSVAPDGSSSLAPPGAPSSAPRVNAGIGPAPESDDGDDKNGQ